jgi:hypothetical protein
VNQTEHEHRQDRGLSRAGGEDRQDIDAIEHLRHSLDLIITWIMGPEVSKDSAYELSPLVRADCLATNTEYCDRCTHAATQATNVARIKTEGTKGLLQGQVAG